MTYNSLGNILTKTGTDANARVGGYAYGAKPHTVTQAGSISFTYDANGNMITKSNYPALTLTWTVENKPRTINSTSFAYDASGQRIKKGSTYYFGEVYEERGSTAIYHIFAGGTRIASVRLNGTTQFYHGNHLGSASVITDMTGAIKQKIEYHPFGTNRLTNPAQYGTYDYDSSFPNVDYTFTDQEADTEFGLLNFKGRLYEPVIGRFISADSIVPEPGNLQAFNRYSYCVNNPLIYVDPTGHFNIGDFFDDFLSGFVAAATYAVVFTATQSLFPANIAIAAAAAGATGGGTSALLRGGNPAQVIQASAQGAGMGVLGGGLSMLTGGLPVLIGGALYAYAQGGVEGLLHFGSGLAGAMAASTLFSSQESGGSQPREPRELRITHGGKVLGYFGRSETTYIQAMQALEVEPGTVYFISHADANTVGGMKAPQLARFITDNATLEPGDKIKIVACNAARGESSVAQQLSALMGRTVVAPDASVWHTWGIGTFWNTPYPSSSFFRVLGLRIPDFSVPGKWITYQPFFYP